MQKEFCVYIWVDPKSDIPRYVGKGLLDRPSKHLAPSADTPDFAALEEAPSRGVRGYALRHAS